KQYHDSVIKFRSDWISDENCLHKFSAAEIQKIMNTPVKLSLNSMPYLTIPLTMIDKFTAIHCTLTSVHYFKYGSTDSLEYYSIPANFRDSGITYSAGGSVDSIYGNSSVTYTSNYNTPDYTVSTVKDGSGKTKKEITYYAPAEIENLGWIN